MHLKDIAEQMLTEFVRSYSGIYGSGTITYNIHNLLRDVREFGALDSFSAFLFESKLGQIKNFIREGDKPLQKVSRRIIEMSSNVLKKSVIR